MILLLWYEHVRMGIEVDKSVVFEGELLRTDQLVNVRQHLKHSDVTDNILLLFIQ